MERRRYRQLLLLLIPLALPSAAIAWLGWQLIEQQRTLDKDLAEKKKAALAAEIGAEVLARLDRISAGELERSAPSADEYSDPAVAFVAWSEPGRLLLPWDSPNPDPELFKRTKDFREKADEIAKLATAKQLHEQAVAGLGKLIQDTPDSLQRAYAAVKLAATLRGWDNHAKEADDVLAGLLKVPSIMVDEDPRTPFWIAYAAEPLLRMRVRERDVLARVSLDIESLAEVARWHSELDRVLTLLAQSSDSRTQSGAMAARERLARRLGRLEQLKGLEQARALQAGFPKLGLMPGNWRVFGAAETWLLWMAPPIDGKSLVIAVRGDAIRAAVENDRAARGAGALFRLVSANETGQPLGDTGLRAVIDPGGPAAESEDSSGTQRRFYVLALGLVVGVTFFGGYLLWRDTRREARIAEMRSQFVSSVSHELKTPLTSIRLFAETLQIRGAADDATHDEFLATIVSETERLTRLLNNVLDFSRIERGQKNYHLETASLSDAVETAARTMRFPLAEEGFAFDLDVSGNIPPIPIDRDAIEQAVLNLLSNAMKYSGQSRRIALRLTADNETAVIEVTDYGVGIPPEEQRRIFEKFYRVPTAENRAISGTGLGLSIVAHIAQAHGGRVDVRSAPGEGSAFSIRIPIPPPDAGAHDTVPARGGARA